MLPDPAKPVEPRYDLHFHSSFSDGMCAVEEIAARAASSGLTTLALTDHDEIRGLAALRAVTPLALIPAVEVSALLGVGSVHILGFGFDPSNEALNELLRRNRSAKRAQIEDMIARLRNHGISIDIGSLSASPESDPYLGRAHLARKIAPRYVSRERTAFTRYLNPGGLAWAPARLAEASAVISSLHEAGGLAILAHPSRADLEQALPKLIELGIDGLEGPRPRLGRNQRDEVVSLAIHKKLLVTGGSDFHGLESEALGEFWPEERVLRPFLSRLEGCACPRL